MNVSNSLICVECDSIFSINPDTTGDYGYLIQRYKQQCPSCGSTVFIPLANIVMPLSNINNRVNLLHNASQ